MCTHDENWAKARAKQIHIALGGNEDSFPKPTNLVMHSAGDSGVASSDTGSARLVRYKFNKVHVDFLVWSTLTEGHKGALEVDSSEERRMERASLNDQIKRTLMNDCLADVVFYLGPNGASIRTAAANAVCTTIGGMYIPTSNLCKLKQIETQERFVFITESLGSKVVFDAVRQLWENDWKQGNDDASKSNESSGLGLIPFAVQGRKAGTISVTHFMISNQIPLLDVGEQARDSFLRIQNLSDGTSESITGNSLFDLFSQVYKRSKDRDVDLDLDLELSLISFTDPNDVLSYRLRPEQLGAWEGEENARMQLWNVLVSNANTYLDIVEHPLHAHCGYRTNPYVAGLIVHGYDGGLTRKLSSVGKGGGTGCLIDE